MTTVPVSVPISVIDRLTGPMRQMMAPIDRMTARMRAMQGDLDRLGANRAVIDMFGRLKRSSIENANALAEAQRKVGDLARQMTATENPTRSLTAQFERAKREAARLKETQTVQTQQLHETRAELSAAGISTRNLAEETRRLDAAIARSTSGLDRQTAQLATYQRRSDDFAHARGKLAETRQRSMGLYGEAMGVAAQGWAYTQMLRPAIAFEAKMAEVGKVVDFEGATGLTDLGNDIQALVTSGALPMAADGIADIVAAAAQASLIDEALPDAEKRRQLVEFADAAGKMGIAFDIAADAAGQAMATWRAQLGLTQNETMLLGDAVNHLSNKMNASAADITDIIGRQGGFAKVAGLNNAEIAALATAFRTAAPSSEVAATAMKNFTSTLVAGEAITKRQSDVMNRLGFDAVELAQRMRVDARGSIIDVMEALQKLPEHEQAASLRQLFGDEAVGAVAPLLGNLENLRRAFELVGDQSDYAGAMHAEYQGVANTTAARLVVYQNYMTRLSVSLMPLLSIITDVTEALQPMLAATADWMQANPEIVKWIGITVAGLYGLKVGFLAIRLAMQPFIAGFWMFKVVAAGVPLLIIRATFAFAGLAKGLAVVRVAVLALSRALLANPIGIAVAAIAAAAYAIYQNWGPVSAWFSRLWGNIRTIFGGFGQFVAGVFSGDMVGAVAGLQQVWDGLSGYYRTLWDGITGVFLWAWDSIEPVLDGLFSAVGLGPIWEGVKTAIGAVLDWLKVAFTDAWAAIKPVVDGLKWVQDKGSAALNSVTGGIKGPISSGYDRSTDPGHDVLAPPIPKYANGGSFAPGLIMVGERGPELRYESRGGFIAHNNALRGLVDLSARAAALAGVVMGAGPGELLADQVNPAIAAPAIQDNAMAGIADVSTRAAALAGMVTDSGPSPAMADQVSPAIAAAPASGARQISYEPHYNIAINGSGLDVTQLRAAIRAEMEAADRRAQADLRRLMHD